MIILMIKIMIIMIIMNYYDYYDYDYNHRYYRCSMTYCVKTSCDSIVGHRVLLLLLLFLLIIIIIIIILIFLLPCQLLCHLRLGSMLIGNAAINTVMLKQMPIDTYGSSEYISLYLLAEGVLFTLNKAKKVSNLLSLQHAHRFLHPPPRLGGSRWYLLFCRVKSLEASVQVDSYIGQPSFKIVFGRCLQGFGVRV